MVKTLKKSNALKSENFIVLILLIIVFVLIMLIYFFSGIYKYNQKEKKFPSLSDNLVIEVISGDSFELNNGHKIKLLCINAPKINESGFLESKNFLESLILNKTITLESDLTLRDNLGLYLRYVYFNDSNGEEIFLNKHIYQNNHATILKISPNINRCKEIEEP
jgi:hypothetical protein